MGVAKKLDEVARGRDCYRRQAWAEAHRWFAAADRRSALPAADLELYAWSASLAGRDDDHFALMERLYQLHVDNDEPTRAARWAFWLGFRLAAQREIGRANGWLQRAQRLTDKSDCVEKGYVQMAMAYRQLTAGDLEGARALAVEAAGFGDRFRDTDLSAFARCLEGRLLLREGHVERGLALIDEVMVGVTSGRLAPVLTGILYCSAIAEQ